MRGTKTMTDTFDIYRTVKRLGSLSEVYEAAAHKIPEALDVLAALAAEKRHESHAFGVAACVRAALVDEPYAVIGGTIHIH
jgi:hypothetical protein